MSRLRNDKLDLIGDTCDLGIESVVDFGGMWNVNGGYLTAVMSLHGCRGLMVDTIDPEVEQAFEYEQCDFTKWLRGSVFDRDPKKWMEFDLAILFDVLLHQRCPMQVLADVTKRCQKAILISQPCLRRMEAVSVNLQFSQDWDDYDLEDRDVWVKENGRPERWTTSAWGWGQSSAWFVAALSSLGWKISILSGEEEDGDVWVRESMLFVPE